jgi:hypothetical protein
MKIYGSGQLRYPGTSRVVWDFEDGPFDTVNPTLIDAARRRGYSFTPPVVLEPELTNGAPEPEEPIEADQEIVPKEVPEAVAPVLPDAEAKRRPGRRKGGAK